MPPTPMPYVIIKKIMIKSVLVLMFTISVRIINMTMGLIVLFLVAEKCSMMVTAGVIKLKQSQTFFQLNIPSQ